MAQIWLVTGSSRGLGRAIVEAGLAAGNKVLATARDIESFVRRRHTSIGIPGTDRNEPLWNDYCDEGSS